MKVLFISDSLWPPEIHHKGIKVIYSLITALSEKGIEVHILTCLGKRADEEYRKWAIQTASSKKIGFHFINLKWFPWNGMSFLALSNCLYFFYTIGLQIKYKFDVIQQFSSSPLFILTNIFYRFFGAKIVFVICTNSYFNFLDKPFLWSFGKFLDRIVVTSSWFKEQLVRRGCLRGKLDYVSLGIDLRTFRVGKRNRANNRRIKIVYVGPNETRKGADIFFQAAKKNIQADFIWVTAQTFNRPKHVKIVKGVTNIAKVYSHCDIAVFPYRHLNGILLEPQTLFEAMASGLAIVVADFPQIRSIVDEKEAFFFQPGKTDEFTKELGALVKNPVLIRELGINARKKAQESFSLVSNLEKLLKIYHDVLKLEEQSGTFQQWIDSDEKQPK